MAKYLLPGAILAALLLTLLLVGYTRQNRSVNTGEQQHFYLICSSQGTCAKSLAKPQPVPQTSCVSANGVKYCDSYTITERY